MLYLTTIQVVPIPVIVFASAINREWVGNFNELKTVYGTASLVAQNRVIFNIKGNDFRLIVSINFRQEAACIIWFGSHAEYNNIDAGTISFNTRILTYKKK